MYTIKRVVELVGLPSDTIRAWERRYGVPRPERSPSGYRLYSAEDVSLLRRMRELVETGMSPSQAAVQLEDLPSPGRLEPALTPEEFVERLETGEWPQAELATFLRNAQARDDLPRAADEWLMPTLVLVGRAWARGSISLLQEHAVSATVLRHAAMSYENAGPQDGPPVLLGLPTGATHEIGVLLFAVMLRGAGVDARYLGADISESVWLDAVASDRPRLVVTACHRPADLRPTRDLIAALRRVPALRVAVGGRLQHEIAEAEQLGHLFTAALDDVVESLRSPTTLDADASEP